MGRGRAACGPDGCTFSPLGLCSVPGFQKPDRPLLVCPPVVGHPDLVSAFPGRRRRRRRECCSVFASCHPKGQVAWCCVGWDSQLCGVVGGDAGVDAHASNPGGCFQLGCLSLCCSVWGCFEPGAAAAHSGRPCHLCSSLPVCPRPSHHDPPCPSHRAICAV